MLNETFSVIFKHRADFINYLLWCIIICLLHKLFHHHNGLIVCLLLYFAGWNGWFDWRHLIRQFRISFRFYTGNSRIEEGRIGQSGVLESRKWCQFHKKLYGNFQRNWRKSAQQNSQNYNYFGKVFFLKKFLDFFTKRSCTQSQSLLSPRTHAQCFKDPFFVQKQQILEKLEKGSICISVSKLTIFGG